MSSPPISPLTYNASEDDTLMYAWSHNSGVMAEEDSQSDCNGSPVNCGDDSGHNNNKDNNKQSDNKHKSKHHRIISEELDYITELDPTPRAGNATHHRKDDGKTPRASNKMSDSSVTGVLAGQRNGGAEVGVAVTAASAVATNSPPRGDASVSSLTSVWRRLHRQRKANNAADNNNDVNFNSEVKRNDTPGTSTEEDEASLRELEENDAFALEVGLMFSTDDGDTIADADLYSLGLPNILTMDSFDTATVNTQHQQHRQHHRNPSSDLSAYLHSHRHNTYIPNDLSLDLADDDKSTSGYIQNPKYVIDNHQQPQQFFNDDDSRDTNTTVRDDHGNRLPPNAKAILSFKKKKQKQTKEASKTSSSPAVNHPHSTTIASSHANNVFPPLPATQSYTNTTAAAASQTTHAQMEKRLRHLAGTLHHEWRTDSTAFIASPALARRLRDFQFAREKRRKKYGLMKPWGILGLYDHLSGVRMDVEWAQDAAWRRTTSRPYLTWGDWEVQKSSGKNRPFFTYFVVSVCTAMMFAAWFVNGWHFEPISVNPMIGPSADTLLQLGAKDSYLIVQEEEIWRLVSPMVLHAGLIHYILNMFALWYVGKAIELVHGHFQAASTFVVPAIGGTILSAIFLPQYITVGASGGIFGLIGACISDIVMNWNLLFNEFVNERGARISHARVLIVLLIDIILNCLLGLTPFVDNFTHLGGMIYGFLCGLSTMQMVSLRFFGDERRCAYKARLFFFRFFGLLVSVAGIVVSSVFLFSGDGETNPCPDCSVMSCIPFPPWNGPNDKWWYCDDCSQATAEGTLNTATGKFIEMDLTCPDESVVNVKVDETWPQDELGLEAMLPMLCRERCF